jgi:integron integrase
VTEWLTYLANDRHVAKNSQNVALQALCYLYREVLGKPLENVSAIRAKRACHVPDVLDTNEVAAILSAMDGVPRLICELMYGCGLRIGDVLGLRVKDVSFDRRQITIHQSKGDKWRYVSFPECLHDGVRMQLQSVRVVHAVDAEENPNGVSLPNAALRRKYPQASRSMAWYYLFPSVSLSRDDDGLLCRHHLHASTVSRSLSRSVRMAGVEKRVTSHMFRHSYATHAHESGVTLRALQQLLGHSSSKTTEIYTHVDQRGVTASRSPIESMCNLLRNPPVRERCSDATDTDGLRVFAG